MKHAVEPPLAGALSIFERTCAYCGARFRVLAARGRDGDTADYACPDCGKTYEAQAAADEPEVQLLGRRTDGKDDRYQETMF